MRKIVIDGSAVYEIDEECLKRKEKQKKKKKNSDSLADHEKKEEKNE